MSEWDRQTTPGGAEGPQWVSAAEAADVAGVTPGTVRYWARNGLIVSEVVEGPAGEKTLVRLDEVLQHTRQEGGTRGDAPSRAPAQAGGDVVTDLPARTSELAPILKSVPEIMAQLTAATDRAARAETKVEFLSAQLADLRRRLAEAEAGRDAAGDVTLPEAWEKTEPPAEQAGAAETADPAAGAAATSGWPAPPAESVRDEPAGDGHEPGPEAVDWTAGDLSAPPAVAEEPAPPASAEEPAPPASEETAAAGAPSRLSLDDIWTQTASAPEPSREEPSRDDDPSEVDWHEPARGVATPREQDSPVTISRPANAPVPDGDDFYGPRRRRWFRRRR